MSDTDSKDVEFKIKEEYYGVVPEPVPSTKKMPKWYSEMPLNEEDEYGTDITNKTAKACMPFFEATTRGWMLPLPADVKFRVTDDELNVEVNNLGGCDVVEPQGTSPYGNNPLVNGSHYPIELQTPWHVDAPDDYMAWVLPPLNRHEFDIYDHFKPYSGIFNADKTFRQLGIVGLLDLDNIHNVRIKSGTPIAQVVFMHRDSFAQTASTEPMSDEDILKMERDRNKKKVNPHRYREDVWESLGGARNIPKQSSNSESPGSDCPMGFGSSNTKD
jgi:hypothetical protein